MRNFGESMSVETLTQRSSSLPGERLQSDAECQKPAWALHGIEDTIRCLFWDDEIVKEERRVHQSLRHLCVLTYWIIIYHQTATEQARARNLIAIRELLAESSDLSGFSIDAVTHKA